MARIILDTTLIEFRVTEKAVPVSILHAHPPPRCCECRSPVVVRTGHDLLPQPAHIAGAEGYGFLDSRKDRVIHGKIAESWVSGDVAAMDTLQRSSQTLYLVWTENRQDLSDPGLFSPRRDVAHLFTAHPDDTFLVRFAYWFTR